MQRQNRVAGGLAAVVLALASSLGCQPEPQGRQIESPLLRKFLRYYAGELGQAAHPTKEQQSDSCIEQPTPGYQGTQPEHKEYPVNPP